MHVHTTSLKYPILAVIPELQTEGMDILIIYDEDIGIALKQVCNDDSNSVSTHSTKGIHTISTKGL